MISRLLLITLYIFTNFSNAFAFSGSSSGTRGGGNAKAAEFSGIAGSVIAQLQVREYVDIQDFSMETDRLTKKFATTKVKVSAAPLFLDGNSVQAINDPTANTIEFDGAAWIDLTAEEKRQLVVHELLGLTFSEISDLNYSYSKAIIAIIDPTTGLSLKNVFTCMGTEPFWTAEVSESSASFSHDSNYIFPKTILNSAAGVDATVVVTVNATNGRDTMTGFINRTFNSRGKETNNCSDGMSSNMYPYSFQFFLNGTAFSGCCYDREHPIKELKN